MAAEIRTAISGVIGLFSLMMRVTVLGATPI
jgi:hypothetical protein